MVAARLAGTLAALQVGVFDDHVLPELVLPPAQFLFVAYDFFGTEPAIRRQGDKRKVHMGRLLVHMHHGGDNCFFGLILLQEVERFFKIPPDFGQLLALKKFRCGSEQDLHQPDTVFPGAAASGADLSLGFGPVTLRRLNQVEVMLAAGEVYFSFLRSLWASMLAISGPLYLAKRIMAYCGWLNGGPPFWQFNRIGDGHSKTPFI